MTETRHLRGACNCGRNHYIVSIPSTASRRDASVVFDDSSDNRRAQATPLTAWLRVPLSWYQSATTAFYPDETHGDIRRTYTSSQDPNSLRTFCAYCGSHLSYWSERPASEAEFLSVALGSLLRSDLESLDELGLLPDDFATTVYTVQSSALTELPQSQDAITSQSRTSCSAGGLDWFEELINGSRLGRITRMRRGQGKSRDGNVQVEWEVSEYFDDGGQSSPASKPSKRKLEGGDEDTIVAE